MSVGTGDISAFSGGKASAGSSTGGDNKNTGIGASLDLSGAHIQGHTINDVLDAQETAYLFNSILNNTANTITQGASNAVNNVKNSISNITNSTGFKVAIVGIAAFIAYKLFFKRGRK